MGLSHCQPGRNHSVHSACGVRAYNVKLGSSSGPASENLHELSLSLKQETGLSRIERIQIGPAAAPNARTTASDAAAGAWPDVRSLSLNLDRSAVLIRVARSDHEIAALNLLFSPHNLPDRAHCIDDRGSGRVGHEGCERLQGTGTLRRA